MLKSLIAGVMLAAVGAVTIVPATAQVGRPDPALTSSETQTTAVQYRRYPGYGYGYPGRRRGFPVGAGIAAGIAAGALIGGAIGAANRPAYAEDVGPGPQADADDYCASRFRSYDPSSGTYMGYDGMRHACP